MSDERSQDGVPDDQAALGLRSGAGDAALAPLPTAYRVLARKYRPSGFDDLIGQEAMVRTLSNAFRLGRIHQAYMLTGVRGVGKTTTARILARAFNYEVPALEGRAAVDRPTIDMPELGVHCQAIIESRHIDVIEMDAASNTGVDDVREIIENARFRPVSARTKVYIVDEVHMLSKSAFNALLKTLEEPPEHVKFLFATTEIEKVPITVRSRCQRFDLRRVDSEVLARHLEGICAKENVAIESDALTLIARAAEGSVRDAQSLLDQAIAHGGGSATIGAETINAMLGLADRGRIIDVFERTMRGDAGAALTAFKDLYDRGADPGLILVELAEFTHYVTGAKLAPETALAAATPEERRRGAEFAQALSLATLTRAWQILAKGIQDVKDSPRPQAAADMVLIRLAYAADLPTPEDVLRRLAAQAPGGAAAQALRGAGGQAVRGAGGHALGAAAGRAAQTLAPPVAPLRPSLVAAGPFRGAGQPARAAAAQPAPQQREAADPTARPQLARFEDLVALAQAQRDIKLQAALERDVRLVSFEQGSIEFALAPGGSPQLAQILTRRLQEWTGARWLVAVSSQPGDPSLREQAARREQDRLLGVRADPLVRAVLETFPGAEIVSVHGADDAPAAALAESEASDPAAAYVEGAESAEDA